MINIMNVIEMFTLSDHFKIPFYVTQLEYLKQALSLSPPL